MTTDLELDLDVERAVAGGRMLARHAGRVVFVAGAVPGERVRARVTRSSRQALWADTVEVLRASVDRRNPNCDPMCGGLAFAHISYPRQLELKGQIVADAFRRLARLEIESPSVAGSGEVGYRMRSRLHVRDGRAGFFVEGTHQLCDAGPSGQIVPAVLDAVAAAIATLAADAPKLEAIVVSENVPGTERVLHLEPKDGERLDPQRLKGLRVPGASGITTLSRGTLVTISGESVVRDTTETIPEVADAIGAPAVWSRRPTSFFQGNRFLVGRLIRRVLALAAGDRVADLYAGVGLFTVALAARGSRVLAVEADASASADLAANIAGWPQAVRTVQGSTEEFLRRPPAPAPDTVIVDPPRTGMSADALDQLAQWNPGAIVYVSCDPPTLARDAARLGLRGYRLMSIEGLDLFPNTPHIESIAAFARP